MAQAHEFNTYQVYQRYHKLIHSSHEMQNYMHFGAIPRTNAPSQTEFLPGYLKEMIEGLINDINQFGDSWLLQMILCRSLPAVHVLDHSAIHYVHTAIFAPDDKPKLTNKWIPFTNMYSESVGGLQYADPKATSFTVDIRGESLLHYLAHALQLYAQKKELQKQIAAFVGERAALNSQIAGLKDELFGLRRELESLQNALRTDAGAVSENAKQRILEEARSEAQHIIDEANALKTEVEKQHAELADIRRQHEAALEADRRSHQALLAEQAADVRASIARQLDNFSAAFSQLRDSMLQKLDSWQAADARPNSAAADEPEPCCTEAPAAEENVSSTPAAPIG